MTTIPRDWIERYCDGLSLDDYTAIAEMLVVFDAEQELAKRNMDATIAARVGKLNSVTRNDGYFTKTSEVWGAYNRGRLTMAQRDRAIRAIQFGLPFAVPQPKPAGVTKTPKGPVNLEDLA